MTGLRAYLLVSLAVALVTALTISFSTVRAQPANGKYDSDGDGLIEVEYLEQLDAIRYDLDGDGKADDDSGIDAYAAAYPITGEEAVCDHDCKGYELARPLDFNDAGSYASGAVNSEWTTGEGWQPIQSGEVWIVAENPFSATFDGNRHTIRHLYVNRSGNPEEIAPSGLFGSAADSIIRNVGLIDVHVAGFAPVGGLVGANLGEIRDSRVTGRVSGVGYVGGMAGFTDYSSRISGSHFSGAVTNREFDKEGAAFGGLVGYQDGVIVDSYATGSVLGDNYVGGLAGENRGYIVASGSSAEVTGVGGVGGLAGVNRVLISGSYATGSVTGSRAVGGLAGYNGAVGRIITGYATGTVTGNEGIGGLAGQNKGDITASYATGQVSGNENVGGLAGRNMHDAGITASYATGRVSGGDNLGGVIGLNAANATGVVWDTETSGINNGVGRGDAAGVTGQTTAGLQAAAGYAGAYRDWELDLQEGPYRDLVNPPGPYDFWDFGTSGQYPVLKAYLGFQGVTDWWEPGVQPRDARPSALDPEQAVSPAIPVRYDRDSDGLIEVSSLEQLNAIRYDLDGDGIPEDADRDDYAAAYPLYGEEAVCGADCIGYELTRPLDFNGADSYGSGEVRKEWTTGAGWQPIGGKDDYGGRFNAHFDGNGHAVANLHINRTSLSQDPPAVGLFGYAGYSAVIRDTGLVNASVAGLENVGGLTGRNRGEIRDSYATGSVSGRHYHAGGLVGRNEGAISGSHAAVSMSCGEYGDYIGGLAGWNHGTVSLSHATGEVSCDDGKSSFLGGLTGANWGTIGGSYATGDVTGRSHVGGLTGSLTGSVVGDGKIIGSYATGDVTGGSHVGGLAGGGSGVTRGSYATGRVTGDDNVGGLTGSLELGGTIIGSFATGDVSGGKEVGGLVGSNDGRIIAGYATGRVSGESKVGGLAGGHYNRVFASYATGAVLGDVEAGGLLGVKGGNSLELVSFWDRQTTGQETSAGGQGKTTAELQEPTGYTGIYAGWNADLDDADGDRDPATGADDFWDFGTSSEYPALKFDLDGDGTATWQEFGSQDRAAPHVRPPVADDCVEMVAAGGVVSGAWSSACLSFNRPGSYARFYVFTLDADSEVFITLESDDTDTYLYMQEGANTTSRSFRSQGSPDRYSRIEGWFAAGTYTIEAATHAAGHSGSFTLTVKMPGGADHCVEIMASPVIRGAWSSDCASGRRPGGYARFYTFTLSEASEAIIDLESGDADTYLYLLQGAGRAGSVLGNQGSGSRSSRIEHVLGAGTYTVEVATYSGAQTGDFILTINGLATPPPPPHAPSPTTAPTPTATLAPVPTPSLVPPSTPAPAGPASTSAPAATPTLAQERIPAVESGGACSNPDRDVPAGAAAASMFLLSAPLALIGGLKLRARRRGGD